MRVALCNEVLVPMEFAKQCEYAAALGYDGLELAPYTVSDQPHRLSAAERATVRRAAENAGIAIMGLHYLLVAPKGLSITTPDDAVRAWTVGVMRELIELCGELGGRYMVHGSQRVVAPGETREIAINRARECFAAIADKAQACGIVYCIEPLASDITPVINTITEAAAIADSIGNPAVVTMLDCNHGSKMEGEPLPEVIDRWLPTGKIGHVQINDPNRRGPGQGEVRFAPILAALKRNDYRGDISVEPMEYVPDGAGSAARAIGYVRGILETLEARPV
jgi:D-psicose/D-tagatose/L-ribulose 3-epimerase